MSSDIQTALTVLLVGMITVFAILGLVVLTGGLLIRLVNQFFPGPPNPIANRSGAESDSTTSLTVGNSIPKGKLAAIVATVDIITEGKGKVTDIRTK